MRGLNRNKRLIHYAVYHGDVANTDSHGFETGEITPVYGSPVELYCNVSAAFGEDAVRAFGNMTDYGRTIFVADNDCPINERSIIWFGVSPSEPHNYIVVGRADSKNGVLYAIREVKVG